MATKRVRTRKNIERGARLQFARIEAGYEKAVEAADDLEVDYALYVNYEGGHRGISREKAKYFAEFFKVNFDWLYENVGDMKGGAPKKAPDILDGLPPIGRQEALDFIAYLKVKHGV